MTVNHDVAWYKSSDNSWYSWCYKVIEQSGWDDNLIILYQVGIIYAEGSPVPIPNTEVKLCRADNTWVATLRKDR